MAPSVAGIQVEWVGGRMSAQSVNWEGGVLHGWMDEEDGVLHGWMDEWQQGGLSGGLGNAIELIARKVGGWAEPGTNQFFLSIGTSVQ